MPRVPSTNSEAPSGRRVALPVPRTAGIPYSRATMAAWDNGPPESATLDQFPKGVSVVGLSGLHISDMEQPQVVGVRQLAARHQPADPLVASGPVLSRTTTQSLPTRVCAWSCHAGARHGVCSVGGQAARGQHHGIRGVRARRGVTAQGRCHEGVRPSGCSLRGR